MAKNVYMGPNSVAGIPSRGQVNTEEEIIASTYAVAFDAINRNMLTRTPGEFDNTTVSEIVGRLSVLKMLAKKHRPSLIPVLDRLQYLTVQQHKGKIPPKTFLREVRKICSQHGLSTSLVDEIEARINALDGGPGLKGRGGFALGPGPVNRRKRGSLGLLNLVADMGKGGFFKGGKKKGGFF